MLSFVFRVKAIQEESGSEGVAETAKQKNTEKELQECSKIQGPHIKKPGSCWDGFLWLQNCTKHLIFTIHKTMTLPKIEKLCS